MGLPENLTQPADTFVGEEWTIPKIKRLRHLQFHCTRRGCWILRKSNGDVVETRHKNDDEVYRQPVDTIARRGANHCARSGLLVLEKTAARLCYISPCANPSGESS